MSNVFLRWLVLLFFDQKYTGAQLLYVLTIFDFANIYSYTPKSVLQDSRIERHALNFSCKNTNIAVSRWPTIDRRVLQCTKKRCPTSKTKEKHSEVVGGHNHVKIKPYTSQRLLRETNNTLCTPQLCSFHMLAR